MFLLKRKKQGEDEEVDEGEEVKSGKSGEHRKRKESPRPWGKGERYLVFGVLVATVVLSLVLALYARSWKLPGLPRMTLPQNVFEETFVLEGKPSKVEVSDEIIRNFNEATREASGVYGLYVVELSSGTSFGIAENELFQAASLIKLPVMAALYEEEEKRKISLDDTHILVEADKVGGSGSLYYEPVGTVLTYRKLVELMGKQSDNTAFNIVSQFLEDDNIQSYIEEIGMRDTSFETNMTTPRDIGIFFKKLWEGRLVNVTNKDEILTNLTDTIYEDWIPKNLPDEIEVSHKFGRELHVVNDAGIVRTKRPYVLVIMSKGVVETEADKLIPELARIVYEKLQRF